MDCGIYLRAGPEIGVASTKAFTAQVLTLVLFAVKVGRERGVLDEEKAMAVLSALREIPDQVEYVSLKSCSRSLVCAVRVADPHSPKSSCNSVSPSESDT